MVVITTPNFLKALDTLNNLVSMGTNEMTERQLRPLTNLKSGTIVPLPDNLKKSTIVDFPTNESQTRYLSPLDTDLLHVRGCSICSI